MERTTEAFMSWIKAHMDAFAKTVTEEELRICAHTLVYNEKFEEFIYLNLKHVSFVLSRKSDNADEAILQHYGERPIKDYMSFTSDTVLPGYNQPLRVTKIFFCSAPDAESKIMPADIKDVLLKKAQVKDHIQYRTAAASYNSINIYFAWKNVPKRFFLYRLAQTCRRHNIVLADMHVVYASPLSTDCILLGNIHLEGISYESRDNYRLTNFMREVEMLKGLKDDLFTTLVTKGTISGNDANLLRAMSTLIEQILTDVNPTMYTEESCMEAFVFHPELSLLFLEMFNAKFNPREKSLSVYDLKKGQLLQALKELDTGKPKHDDRRRNIFLQAVNVTDHCLHTNFYRTKKILGIGFRLNPAYMDNIPNFKRETKYPELPFGIFFVKGWSYFGMQIRFRDLARGGMRTVIARDQEQAKFERTNMFSECYNLAFTQQKKNKDIPEGGSKSVVFLCPNDDLILERNIILKELESCGTNNVMQSIIMGSWLKNQQSEHLYYNQRCFLQTFLSLFVWDFQRSQLKYGPEMVDYLCKPEYIYLGPDENMHDCQIEWLAKESVRFGYYSGGAFISGKEHAGINHKEFGVTSWGMFQYLRQSLKFVFPEKEPEGKFTVKMTGGPDGDVAGNMMRLFAKHMPERAQLVAVTDATGTCYDPEGLNYTELCKMFHSVSGIADYPADALHDGAFLLCMQRTRQHTSFQKEICLLRKIKGSVKEEWLSGSAAQQLYRRNVHEIVTDVFVPSGGRPRTLNIQNVTDFLDKSGKPTSKVIIEGANLYLTQEAREFLEEKGVIIFKDSSANKCGVVSSSYEILAGLSLTDEDFEKAKPILVENVLSRLEKIANDEAIAMLEYYRQNDCKVKLSLVAELVSKKINQYTDEIAAYLLPLDLSSPANKKLLDVFINYVPDCIKKDHLDRCLNRVPDMHKKAIISTALACRLVYSRGIAWSPSVVDILPVLLDTLF